MQLWLLRPKLMNIVCDIDACTVTSKVANVFLYLVTVTFIDTKLMLEQVENYRSFYKEIGMYSNL